MKQHDHDMIAEDRPSKEPFAEEITITTKILGTTKISFICFDTGDEYRGLHFTTCRRAEVAFGNGVSWIDPLFHETAHRAILDALTYMSVMEQLSMTQVMRLSRDIYDDATTFFENRDKPSADDDTPILAGLEDVK